MKKHYLSKSDFLKYQTCPGYLWLWKNNRELVPQDDAEDIERRIEQGNEVESYARKLFPDGVLVEDKLEQAQKKTDELVAAGKNTIFQATAITTEGLLAMADIIVRDGDKWDIYEVKSTTDIKKEHINDAAFQLVAFEKAGFEIGKVHLIHLNSEYKRHGSIEPKKLFIIEEVTEKLREIEKDIEAMTGDALDYVNRPDEPNTCSCNLKTKSNHCPTFKHFHPDVPEYSIYNLTRISNKKINTLVDMEVYHLDDIPDGFELTDKQQNQLTAHKIQKALIDHQEIKKELAVLKFPLYFLDYETVSTAVPMFEGTWPYQQVPFQYSLHIFTEPNGKLEHHEYLAQKKDGHPIPGLLEKMKEDIGPIGSVIVWNKNFEMGRNTEMGESYPEYRTFLADLNERVYDLMDIFTKQYHVHPEYHGSTSIKYVLPVLVPELSYKEMNIPNGAIATTRWYDSVARDDMPETERAQIYADLLKYCELDTLAMYKIYEHLYEITENV
jgi:CRISPR/Cas system-associated exonuclease Cas4 (RecB family)